MFEVTLLGTGGTMPLKNRWLSSCLIKYMGHSILIDCGEGTQIALKHSENKFKPIDIICITHFHADHISGLPGFLLSMSNEGRENPVTIIGPEGLKRVVKSLCVIAPNLPFELQLLEYPTDIREFCFGNITVTPFKAEHSVTCLGYNFTLARAGKFDPEKAQKNQVPMKLWSRLQKQEVIYFEGKEYTPEMVLGERRKGIKVTYCTDTRPTENIISHAEKADLLIYEGMFGNDEKSGRARETGHSLFSEAGKLAKKADVKKMWLTHYSPSLTEPEEYESVVKDIFANTELGYDGKSDMIYFPENEKMLGRK